MALRRLLQPSPGSGPGGERALPTARSQLALARSSSSGDSSKPQRHLVAILKEDKETFGFEIQTIRFPQQNDFSLEVCTCVCRIQEESPAHLSGLQAGDILTSINGVSIQGFGHKQIVDLIKSSGNYLRLETANGALFLRKMELEAKLQALKVLWLIICSPAEWGYGTLPRKSRRASVRKHLLRFIPGFHRAVEEEESRV
ncbi:PREDICTED: cytohesin-interacting protein [Ficedula albicollis]|uniref:cytohesin-interacting protein n=1 Tax=Ficedula albicollis TaxID=59894 RepID=UPI0007AD8D0B|nr:PREDICTED: cytohesin-interacting protein [Ficedula albicollis]